MTLYSVCTHSDNLGDLVLFLNHSQNFFSVNTDLDMVYFIICSCIVCFKPIRAFCSDKDDWTLIVSDTDLEMISSVRAVEITAFSSTKHSLIMITHRISPEEQKVLSVTPTFFQMIMGTRRTVMNHLQHIFLFAFK